MADRSLYGYVNIGSETQQVSARSLYEYENVGAEAIAMTARSLFEYENVGENAQLASRSLYEYLNIAFRTDPNDPVEIQLLSNTLSVDAIVRAR
jgi:hypothetical protein